MSSIDDFFADTPEKKPAQKVAENKAPEETIKEGNQKEDQKGNQKEWTPVVYEVGQDIEDVFLLDALYDAQSNSAELVFYHPETKSIYRWRDTTHHHPYLYTTLTRDELADIPEVVDNKNFIKITEVEKTDPYSHKIHTVRQVFGKTPLEIGGDVKSFRNFINPAYEADIRYHLNFLADRRITPATFYSVRDGKLISKDHMIDEATEKELKREFAGEKKEELEMLDEYMPLLFQETPDILRAAYDIEVGSPKDTMPNKEKANYPIISIALVDSDDRKIFWVLNRPEVDSPYTREDVDLRRYDEEREMLEDFFEVIDRYPLSISFNGDNFDNPYLENRAKLLRIDSTPIIIKRNFTGFKNSLHLDLHVFFRQPAIRLYAFGGAYERASLQEISSGLLGEGKVEHEDVWIDKMDLETLMKYNVRDSEITLELTRFNDSLVMQLIIVLMRISKSPFIDFTRQTVSTWLKFWIIWEHRKRNLLIPSKEDIQFHAGEGLSNAIIDGKKFQGAIVIDPVPGIWWDVQVWDFASLYPSIIKTRNLSYETINCQHPECRSNQVPELEHWVCTKYVGIMGLMIGFVRDIRVKYFKPRKKQHGNFRVIEQALKVLINAGYGVIGSSAFDFYCLPVAESTTAYARNAITGIKDYVTDELGIQVLYGDTDSVFLLHPSESDVEKIIKWSIGNLGIEIGLDYNFRFAIFSARKKNYIGVGYDGKPVVKGLVGKKRNTPNIIRSYFTKILDEIVRIKSEEDFPKTKKSVVALVKKLKHKIDTNDLKNTDVIIRTTFTARPKDYSTWTQPIQALAQLIEAGYPGADQIDIGDSIEYVPVSNKVQVNITKNLLAFGKGIKAASVKPIQLVTEEDVLGKNLMEFARTAFEPILGPFDIDWEKDIMGQQSLDDWF